MTTTSEKIKPDDKGGFSRFDVTVGGVVALLIASIVGISLVGHPALRGEQVAFLYPARDGLQNIYVAPVDNPDQQTQLTDTPMGVYDFDVSNDGRYIAYAARDPETRLNDLWLLDLYTDNERRLTNCAAEGIDCRTPVFKPDGAVLAYERQSRNQDIAALGTGAIRIWLLDIANGDTTALSPDPQLVGYTPQWSADGRSIAFYSADITQPGILVYNFGADDSDKPELHFIPSQYGTVGDLSPDGETLIYPDVVQRGGVFSAYLRRVDLAGAEADLADFTAKQEPHDDTAAEWHPDGEAVTVLRRYLDERGTPGHQLYTIDVTTGEESGLLIDPRYNHSALAWNTAGDALLMQRFPMLNEDGTPTTDGQPQVWVLDTDSDTLVQIANGAFLPRWVPTG